MIEKIKYPLSGDEIIVKLNEIIDVLNNYDTAVPLVSDISVEGTVVTITYTDDKTSTVQLQDTTYSVATEDNDGLMSSQHVIKLMELDTKVAELSKKV